MVNTPAQKVVSGTLTTNVANAGTFTVSYPPGFTKGSFDLQGVNSLAVGGNLFRQPKDFTVSFGASSVTITNASASTWLAGASFFFGFSLPGVSGSRPENVPRLSTNKARMLAPVLLNLGSPATAAANGISLSQSVSQNAAFLLNGATVVNGVAVLDVPRNIVAAWTTNAKITITGTDEFGVKMIEQTGSAAAAHTGKKAFKTVTSITSDTAITAATVGTGNVFGFPVVVPMAGLVTQRFENGVAVTNGTIVGADNSASSATSGDIRGTFAPNTAADGSTGFEVVALLGNPEAQSIAQFGS